MLRELGSRVVPACAALDTQPDGRTVLVVVERVARGGVYGDQEIADWVRDARRLATLEHPNVARIRDVVIRGEEVFVVGEFVDGVRWSELVAGPQKVSLEIALRVLVDVLSGLSAVHNLRDAKREPLKLVHGELTPDCVVVGLDGVARLVSTCGVRSATARPGRDGSAYLAPEVLLADETADARADVYSAGVMLWEALSGRPLFPNTQPSAIVTHLLSGKVLRATIPDGSPWAAPLADVASRALSADPEKRFMSAAALAADVRRIAGPKLAPPVRVAAFVRATFGDHVQARRAQLERGEVRVREGSGVPDAAPDSVDIPVDVSPATISTAPTPIPPPLDQVPAKGAAPARGPAPPPVVARVAPKPPALPNLRPRQPTLAGVAPPASLHRPSEGEGTPVVVPPSDPPPPRAAIALPTPFVAFEVPAAARISTDIAAALQAAPIAPNAPIGPIAPIANPFHVAPAPPVVLPVPATSPPTPATPLVASLDEPLPPRKPRRGVLVAVLAGPILFAMALLVWWLMARSPQQTAALPAPPAPQPMLSAAATSTPPADTPTATASAATTAASTATTAPVEVAPTDVPPPPREPAPLPTASPNTTPTAMATTPPPVNATPPWTPPTAAPPPTIAHPNKHKYEPEGI
jgi:serine/threonine-protein kinase